MKVLVCGAAGFLGSHLANRLKAEGHWVRAVSRTLPAYSKVDVDEYLQLDLRTQENCLKALEIGSESFDEVYQLAADMGGIGYISNAECDIMRNGSLINANMIDSAARKGVKRYFLSSSVCIYRDMQPGEPAMLEEQAYPACPDNEYGWEKLYAERMALAYGRKYQNLTVRIGRLQTAYGPECVWQGGREKAPLALCRKVAEAKEGASFEVWGDGSAVRAYLYLDDMLDGIMTLMRSELQGPVNIGSNEYVSVRELVDIILQVSGKKLEPEYIAGPVGVQSRNFSNEKIYSTGWQPKVRLRDGIERTHHWVEQQLKQP